MRKRLLILAGICGLVFCAGCGQGVSEVQEQELAGTLGNADTADEAETDRTEADSEALMPDHDDGQADAEREEPSLPADEGEPDEEGEGVPENGRRLTEAELAEYTEWPQDASHYGFLLSEWENPAQIDLYQVFYNGAGIGRQGTEEEQGLFERYGQQEIYTDFQAVDKADVSALLLRNVGLTYDELAAEGKEGNGGGVLCGDGQFLHGAR